MIRLRESHIKTGLLVFGALTLTMIGTVFAPQEVLMATFGAAFDDPLALMIVRSWGALIGLIGGMLVYAAFHPDQRRPLVIGAMISKIMFLGLLITYGAAYLAAAMGVIIADTAAIAFMAACVASARSGK